MAKPKRPKYRVVYQEEEQVVGRGDGRYGTVQTFLKACSNTSPYCVPNELICGEIGRFLRLPIPPLGIVDSTVGHPRHLFASLRFAEEVRPGVNPERCVASLPSLCAGVLAFDILIANEDRHDENLAVDSMSKPKTLYVFDHDVALFGWDKGGGKQRLTRLFTRLGVSGGTQTKGNRHCFLDLINSAEHLLHWVERIRTIPTWFIAEICREAVGLGIDTGEADAAIEFLKYRRNSMDTIIQKQRAQFKAIHDWGLTL
jgi:hypothetical protein